MVYLLPKIPESLDQGGGRRGPFPVTLFINHESRQETLKYYTIFSGFHRNGRDRSMCINPRIDIIHVTLQRLVRLFWPNNSDYAYDLWLKELSMKFPSLLGSIKTLEINDASCVMRYEIENVLYYIENEIEVLPFFTGLEEVGFWPQRFYNDQGDPEWRYVQERTYTSWNDVAESVVAEFQALFEKQKKENPMCADPKVVLRRTVLDKCPEDGYRY